VIVPNRPAVNHCLKTHPGPFWAVCDKTKLFEVRVNDRDFRVGDTLTLQGYDPDHGYTGLEVKVLVTYYLPGGAYGLPKNLCVMCIKPLT
jgi:hypothetical protein